MNALRIAAFEFRSRLRMISTWVYFAIYAFISGFWMAASGGAIEHASVSVGSDKILINGPYATAVAITIMGFIGVTVVAAIMGRALQQDFEYGTFHFFFTAPIHKRDYFFGRFLGAALVLLMVFISIAAGLQIGAHWPGVDPARVAPFTAGSLLRPYLYTLLPNMLWLGGVFFVIAGLTRAMAPVYVAGVLALIGYLLALDLIGDMENKTLASLVDPSGTVAIQVLARYWSVAEKNLRQVPLSGVLLWNRLLWVGLGVAVTAIGFRIFKMDFGGFGSGTPARSLRRQKAMIAAAEELLPPPNVTVPRSHPDFRALAYLRELPAMIALHLRETVKSPRFYAVVAGGAIFILGSAKDIGSIYGTSTWPVTYQVLEITSSFFQWFILIITAINAGELVWRERDARMDEITDSAPVPTWLGFLAKLITLLLIQAILLAVIMACTIGIQLWQGYYRFELGHYLFDLYVLQWPRYWLLAALALFIHVLVNQKYLAHFAVVVVYLALVRMPDIGLEDRLYRFGSLPAVRYSDMNHYGHFLPALFSFQIYWSAAAVLLLVLASLYWIRGKDTGSRIRSRAARQRMSAPIAALALAAALVFVATGSWIFYNTHVLNPYRSKYDQQRLQAQYERRYKALEFAPQPKITRIEIRADLFPHAHRARIAGTLTLLNKTDQPISDLYVRIPSTAAIQRLEFGSRARLLDSNRELLWLHYRLEAPIAPGAQTPCDFDILYQMRGFMNDGAEGVVVDNGTFLNGAFGPTSDFVPSFGYSEDAELSSDRERKKFGLPPKERAHDLDDPVWRQRGFTNDADWVDYSATISTDADQLATTSGYLDRQWTEHGRAYFHYRMDAKMAAIYPFQSGRYSTRKDRWVGPGQEVAIEIDYHPGHEFDLDRMVAGVKDALSYFSRNFGPYQHRILRIIEFPRYASFAESFPNTVPFSEAIGFIAKVNDRDPKDIDYPYFVTAHEVAHQWWGHQEMPASVQGGEFISESLAEYSALMVLKHRYGDERMRRFLRYELDAYFLGRSTENKKEQPLFRADGPAYLHYRKGSLALYALQDAIGEAQLNRALAAFVRDWRFKGPPYPTSRDLLARIREVTPPEKQYLITDLFETITLFDNRATAASYRPLGNGRYAVELAVFARKSRAAGLGAETDIAMDEDVDIGVFDAQDKPLLLKKMRIRSGASQLHLEVGARPARAGIDPLNKLIDRSPEDNMIGVSGP